MYQKQAIEDDEEVMGVPESLEESKAPASRNDYIAQAEGAHRKVVQS